MSVASALVAGRRAAERRMTSRAVVRRPGGKSTGPGGFEVDGWTVTHTNLRCRVAGREDGGSSKTLRVGDTEVQTALRAVRLPWATTNLRDGDLLEVTAGDTAGTVWRLVDTSPQDQATDRRVNAVEVQRPVEWS